jgi:CRP-like cAMP-binding protein
METGNSIFSFWYGIISAVSLPAGALLGLWLKPSNKWSSSIMAFGAGALLSALALELVASGMKKAGFAPLGLGCIIGALLFMFLNKSLNSSGGFLRKKATTNRHLSGKKLAVYDAMLIKLGRINLFTNLPPEEIQAILPYVREVRFDAGSIIFRQGDTGDNLYLVESGNLEVFQEEHGKKLAELGPGDSFGEMALISREPRNATVKAVSKVTVLAISAHDFNRLLETSHPLKDAVSKLYVQRVEQRYAGRSTDSEALKWSKIASAHIDLRSLLPSDADIHAAKKQHSSAFFAIWLGALLDGVPESLVIGASLVHSGSVSTALIAGVLLSNLPEALSSAVGMRKAGESMSKIVWMWTSLMIIAGISAFLGNVIFGNLRDAMFVCIEGVAAGAMLAMVAETHLLQLPKKNAYIYSII